MRKRSTITRSVCAAPSYLKRKGTPKSPEELKEHDCLIYTLSTSPFDWRFTIGSKAVNVHVGGGIRYNFWGHLFIRPEIHYYKIINNDDFSSGNVFRAGASIGYSLGPE